MVFYIFIRVIIQNYEANSGDPDQTIRRRILWRLVGVVTICLCPTKRRLGIYGLKCNYFAYLIRVAEILKYIVEIVVLGTSDLSKFIVI